MLDMAAIVPSPREEPQVHEASGPIERRRPQTGGRSVFTAPGDERPGACDPDVAGFRSGEGLSVAPVAEAFAAAGFVVLLYDHRNFGESPGEPRQEVDAWQQVRDMREVIRCCAAFRRPIRRGSGYGERVSRGTHHRCLSNRPAHQMRSCAGAVRQRVTHRCQGRPGRRACSACFCDSGRLRCASAGRCADATGDFGRGK